MTTTRTRTKKPGTRSEEIPTFPIHRITVKQYHQMIDSGALTEHDPVELIHGWLVKKMPINPRHAGTLTKLTKELFRILSEEWIVRTQAPITLPESEPEPDAVIVRDGEHNDFASNPGPKDIAWLAEVSDSSLDYDRKVKLPLYADNKIEPCWIVNIPDGKVEVYTNPRRGKSPGYRQCTEYVAGDEIPVMLAGKKIGQIAVLKIMPYLS